MNFDERKYVLVAAVTFICIVFILRLFWIQVVDPSWTARAADISERKITVFPSRGLILEGCWWPTPRCTTSWWCRVK